MIATSNTDGVVHPFFHDSFLFSCDTIVYIHYVHQHHILIHDVWVKNTHFIKGKFFIASSFLFIMANKLKKSFHPQQGPIFSISYCSWFPQLMFTPLISTPDIYFALLDLTSVLPEVIMQSCVATGKRKLFSQWSKYIVFHKVKNYAREHLTVWTLIQHKISVKEYNLWKASDILC